MCVGDHASKMLSSVVAQRLMPSYVKFVSPLSVWCHTSDGSYTCFTRSVPFWMSHGCIVIPQQRCTWICRKPLTLAIREAISGMPEGLPEDRYLEYLRDIGLTEENIQLLLATLRVKGCALHKAGVSPVVTRTPEFCSHTCLVHVERR